MPEPLAVAFVEVRPEVDEFRSSAEEELRAGIGDDAINVQGQFKLNGLSEAKAGVDALATQTQEAIAQLSEATSADFAQGFVAGAQEAVATALELGAATGDVSKEMVTAEAARRAFAAANLQAAGSETILAAATRDETRAVVEAEAAEREFFRTRSRRAQSVGPLRLAGIGVGAGVALFAGVQALRALGEELEVTGDKAGTTEGKLRNFGAGLLSGDIIGGFKALTDETKSYSLAQLEAIGTTEGLADKLRDMGEAANLARSAQAELARLSDTPQTIQTDIARASSQGDSSGQLDALRQARDDADQRLKDIEALRGVVEDEATVEAALEQAFRQREGVTDRITALLNEERESFLAPFAQAVTEARLDGDASKIISALRAQASALNRVIDAKNTSAEDRERFQTDLIQVNAAIESTQDAIIAEEQRHRDAMLDKLLDVGVLEDLEAQAAGGTGGSGRVQRAAAIERTLARGTIDGKRLTRAEKERLNEELISINAEIESEQDSLIAEAERHARDMEDKRDAADQAFLDSLGSASRKANNAKIAAQSTASLNDDIRLSNQLQEDFRASIAAARKTIADAKLRAETIVDLTGQLDAEKRNETSLRRERRRETLEREEESLDLDIQLAAARGNERAEIRAHEAKIRYLQERIRHTREGTNQRKALRVEIAREREEIRRLKEEMKDEDEKEGASFDQLAASFLTELQGFSATFGTNIQQAGGPLPASLPQSPAESFRKPPVSASAGSPGETDTPSPFERGRASGARSQADVAADLRDSRGSPVSQGQGADMIALARTTNRLLREIKAGIGHSEAGAARRLARNATETSQD